MTLIQDLQRIARKGPPGPPPKPGWVWHDETSRWRNPENWEENNEVSTPTELPVGDLKTPKYGVEWAAFDRAPTQGEYRALVHYISEGYGAINSYLRHGVISEEKPQSAWDDTNPDSVDVKTNIGFLLSLMKNQYLTADLTVYRGIGKSIPPSAFEPGAIIEDKAFVSTSVNKEVGEDFVSGKIQLKIMVPKGTNFLFGDSGEEEVILPAGSKFRVLNRTKLPVPKRLLTPVQRRRLTGRYLVSMELINE